MDGPNPIKALFSHLRARRLRRPDPRGTSSVDHEELDAILAEVETGGIAVLSRLDEDLSGYIDRLAEIDPDRLSPDGALAYWMNLYNAGGLDLARRGFANGTESVLRVPGAFSEPFVEVAGESLSLDSIEHGKIRRFGDPRIHSALVCGAVSCPTLRFEAFRADDLDDQLEDQMRRFLDDGGAVVEDGRLRLSRVFLWYGSDFVRPHRMPSLLPAGKKRVLAAIRPWLTREIQDAPDPRVAFQDYDWSLGCAVGGR